VKQFFSARFDTPAFLGDAQQNGRWRTPPFKAQLRQWWRVVYAAEHGFAPNLAAMRREEGQLFGVASDGEGGSQKSQVRIRLGRWDEGALKKAQWPADTTVTHPEVKKKREGNLLPVGASLYQGFGPLVRDNQQRKTTLKANAAIQAGEEATLSIAVPEEHAPRLQRALWLMDRYGTLGGRSRNGWGSYALLPLPVGEGRGEANALAGKVPLRPWRDCLALDWPHAIGRDDQGALIWQTAPHADWKALMKTLAVLKIGLRTQFVFTTGENAQRTEDRHWLSYPVTKHSVAAWGKNARLPNQLRFKVRKTAEGQLIGVIFHMPHLPPPAFRPDRPAIERVWRQVHAFLDAPAQKLTRIAE
jgi:CRISPR-associated protein Cmr1